jgi:hypothetical protein
LRRDVTEAGARRRRFHGVGERALVRRSAGARHHEHKVVGLAATVGEFGFEPAREFVLKRRQDDRRVRLGAALATDDACACRALADR